MPVRSFDNINPTLVGNFTRAVTVYVQVIGPGTVRIARQRETLISPGPGYAHQGLSLATTDGLVKLDWIGELWAIGSDLVTLVSIEIVEVARGGAEC